MIMTAAQKTAFDTFVNSTTGGGVLAFDFPDPADDQATIQVRFGQSLPVKSRIAADAWRVSLDLEVLP